MNTELGWWARRALGVTACAVAGLAQAQVLSSPVGGAPAAPGGAPGVAASASSPFGTGPGYHDPRSAFKPLQEREGIVSWSLLSSVTTKPVNRRLVPVYPDPVKALDKKVVKVQGFMMPLQPGEKQRHFLLSSVPTTCSFCVPAGPEGLVEVRSVEPVKYSLEPVVVEGRLAVLDSDPYGLYYRLVDAKPVP
jgi:hypothetical protein